MNRFLCVIWLLCVAAAASADSKWTISGKVVAGFSDSGKEEKQQKAAVRRTANRTGFGVLYRKELCEYVTSWRVLLLFVLLVLVTAASLNGAISNMSDAVEKSSGYIFLKLFTTNGKSIYSFAVFIAFLGEEARMKAVALMKALRENGIKTEMDILERKVKGQFKYAARLNSRFTVMIGEEELEKGVVQLKNMELHDQKETPVDTLVSVITEVVKNQ